MDAKLEQTFQKIAEYIETTQPLIDGYNEKRSAFVKRAHQVAGVLANRGIIAHTDMNAFVDKIAADETGNEVWNLVEKLASTVSTGELGEAAKIAASGKDLDPFEKLAIYGDARADTSTPGMVD